MPVVFASMAPHGFTLVPEMSESADGALKSRAAMKELARRTAAAKPDVIVITGPHGFRVDGAIAVADVSRGAGTLRWDGRQIEMNVPVDMDLTASVTAEARARSLPVALYGYAGSRREQSVIPMDWGVMTPLWFAGHGKNMVGHGDVLSPKPEGPEGPPVVIVSPSRSIPREALVSFGEAVADAAEKSGKRVAFIASCDWGHRHIAAGPYGYSPASAILDKRVLDAVTEERLLDLITVTDEEATEAAIDGLWQTMILAGVLNKQPLKVDVISYEAPYYYGMIVASYSPV